MSSGAEQPPLSEVMGSLSRRGLLIGGLLLMDPARRAAANGKDYVFTVLRLPFDALRPDALWEIKEVVRVIADAPTNPETLMAAVEAIGASGANFREPASLSVVSIGPVLDSPDKVQLRNFGRDGTRLSLWIEYTRVRMTDVTLPRSLPWRPLLIVPVSAGLASGRHKVEAIWNAVSAIPGGRPLAIDNRHETFHFDIIS